VSEAGSKTQHVPKHQGLAFMIMLANMKLASRDIPSPELHWLKQDTSLPTTARKESSQGQ